MVRSGHNSIELTPDTQAGQGSSSRTRLSLTAVFEDMLAEDARERERMARESDQRRERWRENRALMSRSRTPDAPAPSWRAQGGSATSPLHSPQAHPSGGLAGMSAHDDARSSRSASPPHTTSPLTSPPRRSRSAGSIGYPIESSVYPQSSSLLPARPPPDVYGEPPISLIDDGGMTIEWMKPDVSVATDAPPAPRAPDAAGGRKNARKSDLDKDLSHILVLLKRVIAKTSAKQGASEHIDTSSLNELLQLVDADATWSAPTKDAADTTSQPHAVTRTQLLADTLRSDLDLSKLQADDSLYADRLNDIRQRLGSLATARVLRERQAQPSSARSGGARKPPADTQERKGATKALAAPVRWTALAAALPLLVAALGATALLCARRRADYLMTFAYHDPVYPMLYPIPRSVRAFLPGDVHYDVPFTSISDMASLAFVERFAPL